MYKYIFVSICLQAYRIYTHSAVYTVYLFQKWYFSLVRFEVISLRYLLPPKRPWGVSHCVSAFMTFLPAFLSLCFENEQNYLLKRSTHNLWKKKISEHAVPHLIFYVICEFCRLAAGKKKTKQKKQAHGITVEAFNN